MELALYEFESAYPRILSHLESEHDDPAVQHCIEQAKHHLDLTRELLSGAVVNPQTHYDDARAFYRTLWRILPLMALIQSFESPLPGQDVEENLPDTPSSNLSDEDSFDPATPRRHSES